METSSGDQRNRKIAGNGLDGKTPISGKVGSFHFVCLHPDAVENCYLIVEAHEVNPEFYRSFSMKIHEKVMKSTHEILLVVISVR